MSEQVASDCSCREPQQKDVQLLTLLVTAGKRNGLWESLEEKMLQIKANWSHQSG